MKPGERIREFRTKRGMNQVELGKLLGYSDAYISNIENAKVEPSREFLKKLNEVFGISSDYILYNDVDLKCVREPEAKYQALPTSTKKLLDNVKEILESGNDTMIEALKHNIKAFLEAIRVTKNQNEDKGGD